MTQSGVKPQTPPCIVEKGDKSDLEAVNYIPFCVSLSSVVFSIKFKLNHLLQEQDALMIDCLSSVPLSISLIVLTVCSFDDLFYCFMCIVWSIGLKRKKIEVDQAKKKDPARFSKQN
ncbi:hypothetical protein EDC96DRAFT_570091 [Choanephora cucurbitarum]|nr:hypothetical protein EDC96DRAFT_570091 [Choanephora cucurbitarum]